jgi:hydrogenase maturation factor
VGYALTRLDPAEAERTLALLAEIPGQAFGTRGVEGLTLESL